MAHQYIVTIPEGKRCQFRSMVRRMGGTVSISPAVPDGFMEPNEETARALREIDAGVGLEPFDLKAFSSFVATGQSAYECSKQEARSGKIQGFSTLEEMFAALES